MTGELAVRYARWDGVGAPVAVVDGTTPADPGPGRVLVRVDLATVCGSDLHTVSGRRPGPAPSVLGHEQVGTVLALGPGAGVHHGGDGDGLRVGDRVVWSVTASCGTCDRCTRGLTHKCRHLRKYGHEPLTDDWQLSGGFATHAVLLPGTAVVRVPTGVPDVVAAPAACATATVAAALRTAERSAGDLAGLRVLVSGAGMLGLTAAAMAARAGGRVAVVDPEPRRRARAGDFGAAASFPDHAAALAARGPFDVALDLSGAAPAVRGCLAAAGVGGVVVLAGSVSPGPAVPLDPEHVVRHLLTVVGVHNYVAADLRTAVAFLAETWRRHPFAELVEGRHRLDDLDDALSGTGTAPRRAVLPHA